MQYLVDAQVAVLFSDWCHIYDHPTMGDSAYSHYIVQLQQHGLLKGDDLTDRFFYILTVILLPSIIFILVSMITEV
jgi:CCR4-NOT transcription complex subunit 1